MYAAIMAGVNSKYHWNSYKILISDSDFAKYALIFKQCWICDPYGNHGHLTQDIFCADTIFL